MHLARGYPPATRGKIVVWGLLASRPFGGMTWQVLHHLAGVRRLGFDVWYVEDSDTPVLHPTTYWPTAEYAANVAYLSQHMEAIGLAERWVFRPPGVYDSCFGACNLAGLRQLYKDADAVLNVCGAHALRPEHEVIQCLVYLETDPVENQIAVATGEAWTIQELAAYDHLFTYGENFGAPDCRVPVERFVWHPTRPPVCVDWWRTAVHPPPGAALTTIANWQHSGKDVVWQGETFHWSKHHEFLRFITLPARAPLPLELALGGIDDADMARVQRHGWRVVPSVGVSDPGAYRAYIQSSLGEFTVAKEQYVRLHTGWFSDRSVCYLAAGRPVILQDTGFGRVIPTGEGLFAFTTMADILVAIEALNTDYARHSRAAQGIAEAYFSAEAVLARVMRVVGCF
jgi:hypothetical protein